MSDNRNNGANTNTSASNTYETLQNDRRAIAAAAAATVDGYLRNASRRHRVPQAEGGRGTRRKLAMVTSASVAQAQPTAAIDANDEWDEVDLPAVPVKKQEAVKPDDSGAAAAARPDGAIKGENAPGSLPVVKDEGVPATRSDAAPHTKTETVVVEDDNPTGRTAQQPMNVEVAELPKGTRLPLMEKPQRTAWRQGNDPAYEIRREQMDLLAAQRRSDRIQRTCAAIVGVMSLLERGRLLWREAHHPKMLRALLALHRQTADAAAAGRELILSQAVTAARQLSSETGTPANSKPSLAPAWVTPAKDTVNNRTSETIAHLIKVVNEVFALQATGNVEDTADVAADDDSSIMADWAATIEPQFLVNALRAHRSLAPQEQIALPHTLYFCVIFCSLARMARLDCRLVIAKQAEKVDTDSANPQDGNEEAVVPSPAKMSVFYKDPNKKGGKRGCKPAETEENSGEQVKSKKQPSSCFWVEVWSLERSSFVAVNPCAGCTTLWGAPYTFSIAGDVAVDATPRYTSKFSTAFAFNRRLGLVGKFGFLWKDTIKWDDSREISEVLLEPFSKDAAAKTRERMPREQKQLESLRYSEPIPTTLTALRGHPLFVIESDLSRFEGIYPKDAVTTVGRVKGNTVYKRSAVASLRSRDGWLREGRSLRDEGEPAYRLVPPPASRPFAAPSMFFGMWQTKPFAPLPLGEDGSIPHHGRTSWYVLLTAQAPAGIVHLTDPQIARVARRMQLDFGLAVVGFNKRQIEEQRRGQWEAVIDGIAVREADQARLLHAYKEWMQLIQEQEAAKRRDRSMHWWMLLIQRTLAMDRLRKQYLEGVAHGSLPSM